MNQKELFSFTKKAAKSIKTKEDLIDFRCMLKKVTVEAELDAELYDYLDYDKIKPAKSSNTGSSAYALWFNTYISISFS
jgi:hypothetical protein